MSELETKFYRGKEIPIRADLQNAIEYNKELWRKREKFITASSPIEISPRSNNDLFNRVLEFYGDYVNSIHFKFKPLVGYSVLPELPISWGAGYYFPDFGYYRPSKVLEEFGTDWLTKTFLQRDPYRENSYLPFVREHLKAGDLTPFEDMFLRGLFEARQTNDVSDSEITQMFARTFLAGDLKYFANIEIKYNGQTKRVGDCVKDLIVGENMSDGMEKVKIKNPISRAVLKPILFIPFSVFQITRSSEVMGQSGMPGLINLSGPGFANSEALVHEYLHSISFNENSTHAIPIKGYKLFGGLS